MSMRKYQVDVTHRDDMGFAIYTEPMDIVEAPEGYTAEDYIRDCERNADDDWVKMLHEDDVELTDVTDC